MRLIDIYITGKPCAGKDTIANYLRNEFGFVHFRAGAYLKDVYTKEYGADSQFMKDFYAGALSESEDGSKRILNHIENELMVQNHDVNIIYDGFPRTIDQWEHHLAHSEKRKNSIKIFFVLMISDESVLKRALKRFLCSSCMRTQHTEDDEIITKCKYCYSEDVSRRVDDDENNVKQRLKYYQTKTAVLENVESDASKKLYVYKLNMDDNSKDIAARLDEIISQYYGR